MKLLLRLTIVCALLLPLVLVGLGWLAIEDEPLVVTSAELSPQAVRRARALLRANDPRRLREDGVRTVDLREDDLGLALDYLLTRRAQGGAQVEIVVGTMRVRATAGLRGGLAGRWLNLEAALHDGPGLPTFESLRIGGLRVPAVLADRLLAWALNRLPSLDDGQPLSSLLREVRMRPRAMTIAYEWRSGLLEELRGRVLSPADRERVAHYQRAAAEIAGGLRRGASVTALLQPLFTLARSRSDGDAVAENRAALLVLLGVASGRGIATFVPESADLPGVPDRRLRLHGRRDFTQHFLVSAGVAALGGVDLSDAVGLFKEVDDARFGSGFSFADIAADRAGTRFGEVAVASERSAARLQVWLSDGIGELDLMPSVRDLPEQLTEAQFRARFGAVDSPRYTAVIRDIDRRVAALALYRRTSGG